MQRHRLHSSSSPLLAVAMTDNLPPETDCSYSVSTKDWIWTGTSQNCILAKILASGMVFWLTLQDLFYTLLLASVRRTICRQSLNLQ